MFRERRTQQLYSPVGLRSIGCFRGKCWREWRRWIQHGLQRVFHSASVGCPQEEQRPRENSSQRYLADLAIVELVAGEVDGVGVRPAVFRPELGVRCSCLVDDLGQMLGECVPLLPLV